MLSIFIRGIICDPSNWQDKRVDKLAGKSARHTLRERVRVLEIIVTTKVSILKEFTDTDRRN